MGTNNNSKSKQNKELLSISPLITSLGYTPDICMCGDRPDICLPSFKNKEIGIEVTDYAERHYLKVVGNKDVRGNLQLKAQKDFKKIIDSYIDHFDIRKKDNKYYPKDSKYRISIWLSGGFFPYQDNLEEYKDDIYREIDSFLFPSDTVIDNKFIVDVELVLIPNASKSVIDYQRAYIDCMMPVDDIIISEIIKEKSDKLLKYKECKSNESIKEYWLAICLPFQIQDVNEKYRVSSNIKTDYDKIFFVQGCRAWQVM